MRGGPDDAARYEAVLAFYRRVRYMKTLTPLTMTYLTREIRSLFASFPDGSLKTHLENAAPYLFTFLAYPGMPPHNNPAELEIRDGVVGQRNVRHQITTPDGRAIFSRLTTFAITCRKNGMLPCRIVVEMMRNLGWNMFSHGPQAGRD